MALAARTEPVQPQPMFDGYHKWLGIPKDQRPPTYYQLLGIAPDEQDTEVIRGAAARQIAHVRTFQAGAHAEECARILNELTEAKLVLQKPEKRAEYDARLAAATSPRGIADPGERATPDDASPVSPSVRVELPGLDLSDQRRVASRSYRPLSRIAFVCVDRGGVLLCLVVLALVYFSGAGRSHPPKRQPESKHTDKAQDSTNLAGPVTPPDQTGPRPLPKPDAKPPDAADDQDSSALQGPITPREDSVPNAVGNLDPGPEREHQNQSPTGSPPPDKPAEGSTQHPRTQPSGSQNSKPQIATVAPEDVLTSKGLKKSKSGGFYLADAESEVEAKHRDALAQRKSLMEAGAERNTFAANLSMLLGLRDASAVAVKTIEAERAILQRMPNLTNIDKMNRWSKQTWIGQLVAEEDLRQRNLNMLRQGLPNPPDREPALERLNNEVERCGQTYRGTIRELRQLLDATNAKYEKLNADDQVKTALNALNVRLGHSEGFPGVGGWLEKAERSLRSR